MNKLIKVNDKFDIEVFINPKHIVSIIWTGTLINNKKCMRL